MAERMTLVCDRRIRGGHPCPDEAHTYRVTMSDGKTYRTDLCDTHAGPLEEVRDYGQRETRQPARSGRKTFKRTEVRVEP